MADALCGPSNALQQFKQHTHVDRTLQQDRLTNRHAPAQGFRSHNPNANLLDAEFEAFQAGVPTGELPPHMQWQQQQQQQQLHQPDSAGPAWATDFQRMHISTPPLQHLQHQPQFVAERGPAMSDWAQSFQQQQFAQTAPRAQASSQSAQAFQYQARYGGLGGFQSGLAPQDYASGIQYASHKGKAPVIEQFDEAAFEQAFDLARDNMMAEAQKDSLDIREAASLSQDSASAASHMESLFPDETFESDRHVEAALGRQADDVHAQNKEQYPSRQQEDDALAATAQELLEKVEHNQTDKFRNSQFLELMRKLRDREVKVEGDQMVESVSATPKHSATLPLSAFGGAMHTSPILSSLSPLSRQRSPGSPPPPEFDSHFEDGFGDESAFDHWESSLR